MALILARVGSDGVPPYARRWGINTNALMIVIVTYSILFYEFLPLITSFTAITLLHMYTSERFNVSTTMTFWTQGDSPLYTDADSTRTHESKVGLSADSDSPLRTQTVRKTTFNRFPETSRKQPHCKNLDKTITLHVRQ